MDGLVDLLELAGEIAGGRGDYGDAEGGPVPDDALVKFGDGKVEAVAELVFERTENLTTIFKGLRVRDFEFDGEFGDRHCYESTPHGHLEVSLLFASLSDIMPS